MSPFPYAALASRLVAAGLLALLSAAASAETPAAPKSNDVNGFRDWMAACDNLRTCSAYGVDADIYGGAYIRLARDGAADAPVTITIGVNLDDNVKFKLAFDDASLPGLPSEAIAGSGNADDVIKRLVIRNPQSVAQVIASLRKAGKLVVTRVDPPGAAPSDTPVTEISLSGFAAAMLWIDEQQKRVGTVTAVIGRGDKPAAAVPPLPAAPAVRAAKIASGPAPTKTAPAAALALARKACDAPEPFKAPEDATRLSGDQVMYWFHCVEMSGAYNLYYALVVAAPGRPPQVAKFPFPPEAIGQDSDDFLVNPAFDDKTATLMTLNKGRGIGDCGGASEWVWDGAVFRVTAVKAMPNCKGIPVDDWPTLYRAMRK
ncbi:MAG TPA: DUF1176 domain-containing protein [Xanthobacteraceae bacterium]|nr:DUF1176 domain-containing protein [Xanthobacteraceae bacterium]